MKRLGLSDKTGIATLVLTAVGVVAAWLVFIVPPAEHAARSRSHSSDSGTNSISLAQL